MRTTSILALVAAFAACDGTSTETAQRVEPTAEIPAAPAAAPPVEPEPVEPEPVADAIEEPPVADEPPVAQTPAPTPLLAPPDDPLETRMTDPISEMDEPRGNAISEFPGQDNRISEMDDDRTPDRISDMSESKKE